jgi:hypothetical protein
MIPDDSIHSSTLPTACGLNPRVLVPLWITTGLSTASADRTWVVTYPEIHPRVIHRTVSARGTDEMDLPDFLATTHGAPGSASRTNASDQPV